MGDWSWDAASDVVTLSPRAAEIFGIEPGPVMTWTAMREIASSRRSRAGAGRRRDGHCQPHRITTSSTASDEQGRNLGGGARPRRLRPGRRGAGDARHRAGRHCTDAHERAVARAGRGAADHQRPWARAVGRARSEKAGAGADRCRDESGGRAIRGFLLQRARCRRRLVHALRAVGRRSAALRTASHAARHRAIRTDISRRGNHSPGRRDAGSARTARTVRITGCRAGTCPCAAILRFL